MGTPEMEGMFWRGRRLVAVDPIVFERLLPRLGRGILLLARVVSLLRPRRHDRGHRGGRGVAGFGVCRCAGYHPPDAKAPTSRSCAVPARKPGHRAVIEYCIRDEDGNSEVFALITNLLDPEPPQLALHHHSSTDPGTRTLTRTAVGRAVAPRTRASRGANTRTAPERTSCPLQHHDLLPLRDLSNG